MNSAAIMAVTSHKSEKQMLQSYRGAPHHQWCDSDPVFFFTFILGKIFTHLALGKENLR